MSEQAEEGTGGYIGVAFRLRRWRSPGQSSANYATQAFRIVVREYSENYAIPYGASSV